MNSKQQNKSQNVLASLTAILSYGLIIKETKKNDFQNNKNHAS